MKRTRNRSLLCLVILGLVLGGLGLAVRLLNRLGEAPLPPVASVPVASPEVIARGRYLARVGNCMGCHTARGGAPYAGGRAIETPFGDIVAPNLTPHAQTGLGRWSADEFWRALHNGRSRDGRLLYPAFPYPSYTLVTREDSDAMFVFLRSLEPVERAPVPHSLRFPYRTQAALAVWRALFFRPASPEPTNFAADMDAPSAQLDRGAYLVNGLGHCGACHTPRNAWGASQARAPLAGGTIGDAQWYAPALDLATEAGLGHMAEADALALLGGGVSGQASTLGPMAEVVFSSLQYWSEQDLRAMVAYLQALPERRLPAPPRETPSAQALQRGGQLYERHCQDCHGQQGQGQPGKFPALAGNRAVLLHEPANLIRVVLEGGFAPATAGNPRPYGMPPFFQTLSDSEVADLLSFVRSAWGNEAGKVATITVHRVRERRGS